MHLHRLVISLFLALLITPKAVSEQDTVFFDGQPETIEQSLQRHHIGLTKAALVAALQSQDGDVRSLAAHKLALDGAKDVIPSIMEALQTETAPLNRVNIAFSVALLGEDRGLVILKGTCDSTASPGHIRMLAAQYVQDLHDDSCRDAVVSELQTGDDPDALIHALSIIANFDHPSTDQSKQTFDLVIKALTDESPRVRIHAGDILGRLGNVSAIPFLQAAIVKEPYEGCRSQMQMDIERLRKSATPH